MHADRENLVGAWLHAHEEDTDEAMIFRRSPVKLPLGRRLGLTLREDGSATMMGVALRDGVPAASGRWRVEGDRLVFDRGGEQDFWLVVSVEPGRLVLLPPEPG
ncbi:MAG: hypothetical protein ACO1SV_00645 [Fimbriimonas sp.]